MVAGREELTRIADSIEEDVDEIRNDWSAPRSSLRNIRTEIEAIRTLRTSAQAQTETKKES